LKFIVDQQLPPILAAWLRDRGFEAQHTRELSHKEAPDTELWTLACETDAIVVSKDQDFVQLQTSRGGARLVWVRLGNCDNPTLIARVEARWPEVIEALERGDDLVEVR
jgi:predicted nuclease of predicted toxin-antitoxin system